MKKIVLIVLMAAFATAAFGQKKKFEKIREAKIEFIKEKLALTAEEEKKFLPLYNTFLNESEALMKSFKTDVNLSELDLTFKTDAECEKLINDIIELKQKEVDLIKKHTLEFKKVLPIKKVAMIFKAESEFKRHLVKKLRYNRKGKTEKDDKNDKEDDKE